jgi:glutathione-regulated potassium-efflux system protein KefB
MKPRGALAGLLLSQGGEFGFVLFAQRAAARLISRAASLFGASSPLSMVATPFLMRSSAGFGARSRTAGVDLDGPEFSPETNAIVVGYGRFGQTVAQMLMAKRIPVTLIDSSRARSSCQRRVRDQGLLWRRHPHRPAADAGAEEAEAIFFCHDDPELARAAGADPGSLSAGAVMVRAFDRRQMMALDGLDVALLQREVFEARW